MKTKIKRLSLMVLVSTLLLFGCSESFLDTKQAGVTDINDFFKTDAEGTQAIMSCYNMLRTMNGSIWTSMWMAKMSLCDEIYTGGENSGDRPEYQELTTFTFGPTNGPITNIYRYAYMTIYRANKIVDGFAANPTPYQVYVVAEAKTIRAYMYMELVSLYGPVPLTIHELAPSEWQAKSSTIPDLYAQIELDLNDAIADLPVKSEMTTAGMDIARINKGTAQALLGKVLLYEKKYGEAATVLQGLIDSGEYSLYTLDELGYGSNEMAYSQLFRKSTEFGKESVFEISWTYTRGNDWSNAYGDLWNDPSRTNPSNTIWQLCGPRGDQGFNGGSLGINGGWGFGYPTFNILNAFRLAGDSVRLHGNIATEAQIVAAGGALKNATSHNYPWGCPGFIRLKYATWADETAGPVAELNYGTNLRIIRYADVLLMAAEAYLQDSKASTALPLINQVRNSVNLPSLGTVTLADIKVERQLELYCENSRYQDLVRWGDAGNVLADQGKSIPTGILVGGVTTWNSNPAAGFKSPKNDRFPIPFNEISANPNVTQNPGY
jgi:starch-binding outer membrane protein, SusD/RagB family